MKGKKFNQAKIYMHEKYMHKLNMHINLQINKVEELYTEEVHIGTTEIACLREF